MVLRKSNLFFLISIYLFSSCFYNLNSDFNQILASNEDADIGFSIIGFSNDILLSTIDDLYPQHVEPTLAIGNNGKIFAGWKNALTHNSGGVRVSFTRSDDSGKTWTTPQDMPLFTTSIVGQSDPWLVYHNNEVYYAYLEFSISESILQITLAKSNDFGYSWDLSEATHGYGFADKETMTVDRKW